MPEGTPILAPAEGDILTSSMRSDSYGNYIVLDHFAYLGPPPLDWAGVTRTSPRASSR